MKPAIRLAAVHYNTHRVEEDRRDGEQKGMGTEQWKGQGEEECKPRTSESSHPDDPRT